jgi:hypothetical protein
LENKEAYCLYFVTFLKHLIKFGIEVFYIKWKHMG